jgi:hypothetical protein
LGRVPHGDQTQEQRDNDPEQYHNDGGGAKSYGKNRFGGKGRGGGGRGRGGGRGGGKFRGRN